MCPNFVDCSTKPARHFTSREDHYSSSSMSTAVETYSTGGIPYLALRIVLQLKWLIPVSDRQILASRKLLHRQELRIAAKMLLPPIYASF